MQFTVREWDDDSVNWYARADDSSADHDPDLMDAFESLLENTFSNVDFDTFDGFWFRHDADAEPEGIAFLLHELYDLAAAIVAAKESES